MFRYICVCYPTRGAVLCSLQRAKVAIFAIYVTSTIVCIPNYMVTSLFIHVLIFSIPSVIRAKRVAKFDSKSMSLTFIST